MLSTRVGDQDVDLAELGEAGGHSSVQGLLRACVALDRDDAAVELLDALDGLGQVVAARERVLDAVDVARHVDRDDVGAFARQGEGV